MFDRLAQELEAIKDPKSNKDFYITKQEFEDFCKWFLVFNDFSVIIFLFGFI